MEKRRLVVVGTTSACPYAGLAWMHVQITLGLLRLGHEVYYIETSSRWPYDPVRGEVVANSNYALKYLENLMKAFGLEDRWAYRRSYSDNEWFGPCHQKAAQLLAESDAIINVSAATSFAEDNLKVGKLVYLGTDPVEHEIEYYNGNPRIRALVDEHDLFATFGENIGTEHSPIPPLPRLGALTRAPIIIDYWRTTPTEQAGFTTVCNWKSPGEVKFQGEKYYWSKDREFMRFLDTPRVAQQPVELALGLNYLPTQTRDMLLSRGWKLSDGHALSADPWGYRDYICGSRGEFTVAKDQNVRLKSGWFSERSACYLAAGRPVITQDTGFGTVLPTGEGLFAFETIEQIRDAFDAISSDYARHSRAAREIAEEYFSAEKVMCKLLNDLGLS